MLSIYLIGLLMLCLINSIVIIKQKSYIDDLEYQIENWYEESLNE